MEITVLGQGGASHGDLYTKLDDDSALHTLSAAHAAGISFFDTSPWYGVGLSECRFGLALHRLPREELQVQTKVGRFLVPDPRGMNGVPMAWIGGMHNSVTFDYSGPAIERQLEDSLQRTGLGRIESLVIHDLEPTPHLDKERGDDGIRTATRHLEELKHKGGFATLQRLRRDGKILGFGAGVNIDENGEDPEKKRAWNRAYVDALLAMPEEAKEGGAALPGSRGLDFLLIANMHSLLTTEAADLGILDKCSRAGVSLIVGGPFSSGILATGADPRDGSVPYYNYQPATDDVRERCRKIERCCESHGVPLIAAALQYPLRHPAVACVIPGAKSEAELASNVELMNVAIPDQLWRDLQDRGSSRNSESTRTIHKPESRRKSKNIEASTMRNIL